MTTSKMKTPWGCADEVVPMGVAADRGIVIRVSTPGHGGYGVREDAHAEMPPVLQSPNPSSGGYFWFEEDLEWAMVALAFQGLFSDCLEEAHKTMRNWYPERYEVVIGRKLHRSESMKLQMAFVEEQTKDKYIAKVAYGDWAWDVPLGFVYAFGTRASDGSSAGFLVPEKEYLCTQHFVLDDYPQWEPDKSLPYTKTEEERKRLKALLAA